LAADRSRGAGVARSPLLGLDDRRAFARRSRPRPTVRTGRRAVPGLLDGGVGAPHPPRGDPPRRRDVPPTRPLPGAPRLDRGSAMSETTPLRLQIAVDCADPHPLARFWAEATGMRYEDHSEQVEAMVAAGYATYDDTVLIDG